MPLFAPKTVAVVGASTKGTALPNIFIRRIREFGYEGAIYPIHPSAAEIDGLPAYKSLGETPQPVDYAYIAIAAAQVSPLLVAARGRVRFAQVISSGFGEVDEGKGLQERLVTAAHQGGMRLLGPNCLGIYTPRGRITFTEIGPREVGAVGIVVGGFNDKDLRDFLGYDLGVAITGSEDKGVTLVVTEGFGEIRMAERTFQLLKSLEGRQASLNGATQIRAGVIRPEVIVPLGEGQAAPGPSAEDEGLLEPGTRIRVIREPYFGRLGRVAALPPELQTIPTGASVRVLEADLDGGEGVTVPRANVEIIQE